MISVELLITHQLITHYLLLITVDSTHPCFTNHDRSSHNPPQKERDLRIAEVVVDERTRQKAGNCADKSNRQTVSGGVAGAGRCAFSLVCESPKAEHEP